MAFAASDEPAHPSERPPSRVETEGVRPEVDAGRFPIKRTTGEEVVVSADIFADGHDLNSAVVRHRAAGSADRVEARFSKGADPGAIIWIACNYTPVPQHNDRFGVPRSGRWKEVLNSDATLYGGSGQGNIGGVHTTPVGWHGHHESVNLVIPPLGMIALEWTGKEA